MNYAPRPEQLSTRDEAIKAALHYPAGLNAARTFADVNAPFAAGAYRYENGAVMAGPDCKFAPGCQNISTQSLAIFNRLGDVQTRVAAVDERMGIVWLRMAWGVRERLAGNRSSRCGNRLRSADRMASTAVEAFA